VNLSNALFGVVEFLIAFGVLGLLSSYFGFVGAKKMKMSYLLAVDKIVVFLPSLRRLKPPPSPSSSST
jgi:hypothetical protein